MTASTSSSLQDLGGDTYEKDVPKDKQCGHEDCSWSPEDALEQNPYQHDWAELYFNHLNKEHDGRFPFEV